ncbi:unnamed protein product, partial [Prorocentrum cordatum]
RGAPRAGETRMAWRSEWVQATADANVAAKERAIPVPLADKNWAQIQAGQAAGGRSKVARAKPPPSLDWLRGPLPPLHKDFYLRHPEPMLQCEEYSFGNLEKAHPVIGRRTEEEVEKFRQEHGICVLSMRGRPPPKPFPEDPSPRPRSPTSSSSSRTSSSPRARRRSPSRHRRGPAPSPERTSSQWRPLAAARRSRSCCPRWCTSWRSRRCRGARAPSPWSSSPRGSSPSRRCRWRGASASARRGTTRCAR